MLALVLLSYRVPLEEVLANTDEHRAYLRVLHGRGQLLASGPFVPRTGGALLLRAADRAAVDALIAGDPFCARGIAAYDVREWAPTLGAEGLQKLALEPQA